MLSEAGHAFAGFVVGGVGIDPAEEFGGVGTGFEQSVFTKMLFWWVKNIGVGDEVNFVENIDARLIAEIELGEDILDNLNFLLDFWVVDVDNMQQEIRFDSFGEGRLEGFDQFRWKILDKTDGIRDENFFAGDVFTVFHSGGTGNKKLADAGVEGSKEFIGGIDAFVCKGVEKRAFTGVGVADKRYGLEIIAAAALAVAGVDIFVVFQFFQNSKLLLAEMAFHHLDIRLSLSPTQPDGSGLLHQFTSHIINTRTHVPDPR